MIRLIVHSAAFVGLTILTQIGGSAYILMLCLTRGLMRRVVTFIGIYGLMTVGSLVVAPLFGREPLPCFERNGLAPRALLYCAMNRQYVSPELHRLTNRLAEHVAAKHPGTVTQYLDAGFPFADGFPMLPHLSHDDGRKVDLAFYYKTDTYQRGQTPSPLGYWGFVEPRASALQPCALFDRLGLRWDMDWFQVFVRKDLSLDDDRTGTMLRWLAGEGLRGGVEKALLEPHLRARFALSPTVVRFQGCRAARHDDHIHVQVKDLP